MIGYIDTSAVLRAALGQPGAYMGWAQMEYAITSELTRVECLRTLDRHRVRSQASETERARALEAVHDLLGRIAIMPLNRAILGRAGDAFPTSLGSLDAIHLASALRWVEATGDGVTLVTHDAELALAARACGLKTVG